ncbi:MAG: hypothetical protein ACOY71_02580 [Gemmatimonadota bacterium]
MPSNVVLFGWNRAVPGRERLGAQHFQEFMQYLGGLRQNGRIDAFDTVFLDAHGGDLNGFILIRGESTRLDALMSSTDWETHVTRAVLNLEGAGVIRGVTGELVMDRMQLWTGLIPA